MQLYTEFPEFIYEALITQVDYNKGVCTISPLNPSLESQIEDVPLPHHVGSSNSGMFHGLEVGSRVIAVQTAGNGREFVVIMCTLPKESLYRSSFRGGNKPQNTPAGTIPYPEIEPGMIMFRGGAGNHLSLTKDGSMNLSTIANRGLFLRKKRLKINQYLVAENQTSYSNAGKAVTGNVSRASLVARGFFIPKSEDQAPMYSDIDYHTRSFEVGFFSGSKVFKRTYGNKVRNIAISERRTVVNEFARDHNFAGFDNETIRGAGLGNIYRSLGLDSKYNEAGNTLDLAPGELVESISGNVVSLTGKIMDVNYNSLSYGLPQNKVPRLLDAERIEIAKRISRRGIGHHFQLSTASSSNENNNSVGNLVFDIDKEGVLKVNIPRSSDTGNILYASKADFSTGTPTVTYLSESITELIPVMLRDENGEILLPDANSQGIESRQTGVRYSNTDDNPYFPSGTDDGSIKTIVRVNHTKYHNMYAAGERLIANMIDLINIPTEFVDEDGLSTGLATLKPFEVLYPEDFFSEDEDSLLSSGTSEVFPKYMSVAAVVPRSPAIYTGGDALVAGVYYNKSLNACSNSFKLEKEGNEFVASIVDSLGRELKPSGGVSAHLNFEGALYSSIGADNADGKSWLLDTEGSIISWLGKDRNGRSLVAQTDGEMLINVGGTYDQSGDENPQMNVGRFELRVNITDKKFVTTEFNSSEEDLTEDNSNPLAASDIMISLSENGIVIAGMKPGLPMVIRNHDKILIESASSDVVLKGTDVKHVDASGRTKSLKSEGR
nr:hypothetical protein 101 [bacterium]